ncbi:glycosyl transferase, group 2 family protein [Chondrocystis sp. NIES-4102]|nr:glycosyl transferase, group 2 family protein [Chondrocystis sp. NIES-4102]
MEIKIIIVNYRTAKLVINCLTSLQNDIKYIGIDNCSIIVVDNDSKDNSDKIINEVIEISGWQNWASVMSLQQNGGFAIGNNAAIRSSLKTDNSPKYYLLLNPDTIIRPGAITKLIEFMEQHPTVGIAGSRLENPDGSPQRSAFRFHTILSEIDSGLRLGLVSKLLSRWIVAPPVPEEACETDWVAGASMIIRSEVFEQVGLMDESYFLYYEEVDFCLQAKKAGWNCWYVPESRVVHLVGQSSGINSSNVQKKRLPKYWFESRQRYFLKNYGYLYTITVDFVWIFCYTIWQTRRLIQRKPYNDPPKFFVDFISNSSLVIVNKLKNVLQV